jgi:hypothetical protein
MDRPQSNNCRNKTGMANDTEERKAHTTSIRANCGGSESSQMEPEVRGLIDLWKGLRYGLLASHAPDNCGGDQHAQVGNCFEVYFYLLSLASWVDALYVTAAKEEYFREATDLVAKVNNSRSRRV